MKSIYAPPPIDAAELLAAVRDAFPEHKNHPHIKSQLYELVHSYTVWWRLLIHFPDRRIVAPVPLWYIRKVHSKNLERFMHDCFQYLGRIPQKTEVWDGPLDFIRATETARSLTELYDVVDLVWQPLMQTAQQYRSQKLRLL